MKLVHTLFGKRGGTEPLRDIHTKNIAAAIVAMLIAVTGPAVSVLQAATNGGYSLEQAVQWMFATFLFGGLLSIFLALYYRQPVVGAQTLTGLAYLTTVTPHFTYNELIGSFIIAGLLMFLVGVFGVFSKLLQFVPREIISAMLAGMIVKFVVGLMLSIEQMLFIGLLSFATFFICMKWVKRIPPMIGAIFVGIVALLLTEPLEPSSYSLSFSMSQWQTPEFSLIGVMTVSIPLVLLILSNDAAVGIGALQQNNYRVKVNPLVTWTGVFSMITACFGGQSANIAGMMSAVCSDEEAGPKKKRYMASVLVGVMFIFIGFFAWKLLPFIDALPATFISLIVGFSLLAVFANSVTSAFSNPTFRISATLTFAISASEMMVFHISAPVWALLVGTLVARFIETEREQKKHIEQKAS